VLIYVFNVNKYLDKKNHPNQWIIPLILGKFSISKVFSLISMISILCFGLCLLKQGSTIHTSTHYSLASREKYFTRQQKNVTCHNSYYISPICIYLYIIINALNETEDTLLRNGFFSSPDPKGHVRYCHHLASVVRRPSVNFSYFNLLLWNNWTKLNQTWQKASI
jgi:hypothetical protein